MDSNIFLTAMTAAELDTDLDIGSRVEIVGNPANCKYGVVRWLGRYKERKEPVVGLEMEQESFACTDGSFAGRKLFECPPKKAFFVYLHKIAKDQRYDEHAEVQGIQAQTPPSPSSPLAPSLGGDCCDGDEEQHLVSLSPSELDDDLYEAAHHDVEIVSGAESTSSESRSKLHPDRPSLTLPPSFDGGKCDGDIEERPSNSPLSPPKLYTQQFEVLQPNERQDNSTAGTGGLHNIRTKASRNTTSDFLQSQLLSPCSAAELGTDLDIGSMVKVAGIPFNCKHGVVRWLGRDNQRNKPIAGLEMEEESCACTDGSYAGHKLFDCPPRKAFFVYLHRVVKDQRLSKRIRYEEHTERYGQPELNWNWELRFIGLVLSIAIIKALWSGLWSD